MVQDFTPKIPRRMWSTLYVITREYINAQNNERETQ
jgi:hypothetical protein